MSAAVLIGAWLVSAVAIFRIVWRVLPSPLTARGAKCGTAILWRAFAFAYAFSPTAVSAGLVGFVAPATLAFIAYLTDPEPKTHGMGSNQRLALQCFGMTWLVVTVVYSVFVGLKRRKV